MPQHTSHRADRTADSPGASDPAATPASGLVARIGDGFAFSGGLAATIGASLSGVASRALDAPGAGTWALLTASGTFIVYALDRLRDIDRDRASSPLRTTFVVRNRVFLYVAVGFATISFTISLSRAPTSIVFLCLAIGGIGLLHRRLKENAALKAAYVSLAWVAACVGMPWLTGGREDAGLWVAGVLLGSLAANLIASNLQGSDSSNDKVFDRGDKAKALWLARAMAVSGAAMALAAPAALHSLVWIPICEGLALAAFRPTERYAQFAVDGGLLVGAIATTIHFAMTG